MAIDTKAKRSAILYFGLGGVAIPSGSIDATGRGTFIGNYYLVPPFITTPGKRVVDVKSRNRVLFSLLRSRVLSVGVRNRTVSPVRDGRKVVA